MTKHRRAFLAFLFAVPACVPIGQSERAPTPAAATAIAPCPAALAPARQAPEDRQVETWLAAMTLDEKLALVAGTGFDTVGVPRLGIPGLHMTDGPVGVRVGQATAFPASALLAATFDPALVERVGAAIARETKAHGKNVLLAPAVNIVRSPLGRPQLRVLQRGSRAGRAHGRRPTSGACKARACWPRSSTTPSTTRRPSAPPSAPRSTRGRCTRSTCPPSRPPSSKARSGA